jgi:polysaccharide deacetylase family protein (PEP-CTERM system associated)
MSARERQTQKQHLFTVLLEDYFHVGAFNGLIQRGQWYRFETRFEQNTLKALDLLDRFKIKATFFVMGWVADRHPEIVREVARRGHEIASRGLYQRRRTRRMTPEEFREDLRRTREAVELASGTKVHGFRAARHWKDVSDLWMLDVLAEEGYVYDSSLVPVSRVFNAEPRRRFAHQHQVGEKSIWEFPLSTCNVLGWRLPVAGGNYFRQFPHTMLKHVVAHWDRAHDAPFVMYAHVWELDPEQPRISSASRLTKLRHYRNLDKMSWVLEDYFNKYKFTGIAQYLGLDQHAPSAPDTSAQAAAAELEARVERRRPLLIAPARATQPVASNVTKATRTPVSIVVPCFNEESILPYLANTLKSVEATLAADYELHYIFVDDCSTDKTSEALRNLFGSWPNCTFVQHKRNLGVAAAILNGIRHAETEIVCSIDCDCTYDPHEMRGMIALLEEDVAMVTASPYHPQGRVRNVPGWRLSLSKGASFLYRLTLRQRLYTYTSCFRAYRRSAVVDLRLRETSFLGVAETLGRLDLRGAKIVEYPTTLEVRLFGQSKMKVIRTIGGHLQLLTRLLALRLRQSKKGRTALLEENYTPAVSMTATYPTASTKQERT